MPYTSFDSLVEVFLINTEGVRLVGNVIYLADNKGKIDGWVMFRDGRKWRFTSPMDDLKFLSKKLMFMCQGIAGFYGTEVVHHEFRRRFEPAEITDHLKSSPPLLH